MKKFLLAAAVAALVPSFAMAQTAPAPALVEFKAEADMPSLRNPDAKDTFTVNLADSQVTTKFALTCQAGRTKWGFVRQDKGCQVTGNGNIINPATKQAIPRAQIMGGFMTKKDGFTEASTLIINYLAVGRVPASSETFKGSLNLKPELTSSGAKALQDAVLQKVSQASGSNKLIDDRVDTIDFNGIYVPSAGLPSDKGCTWSGNMIFAYQTETWFLKMTANCAGKEYPFSGNMPWTETPNKPNQTQYNLTLTMPSANSGSNDALFASAAGTDDLFATVDGITAQILMDQGRMVTVKVDGKDTETPSYVKANGNFTGTNVPVEVVRSLATLFGLLSSNLFGA